MITQQQLQDLFEYRDGALYWRVASGNGVRDGARAGCLKTLGYRVVKIDGRAHLEHRLIFRLHNGYLPKFIDHRNGNRADNRIENLRPCTQAQNQCNAKTPINNTTGVKGVSWRTQEKCWQAHLGVEGKKVFLGRFTTLDEAKTATDAARAKHHGEFARF